MEPARNFTRAEYDARVAKTRVAMQKRGIELLICSDPSNMSWLTGYDGWSFYVHQCVLLALDGDPVWYGRGQDANGARRTAYMSDADIIGYPDHYVQSEVRHPMDYLSERIVERGWDKLSIGVEMDNYWFSAKAYASLREHLPNAKFIDATGLVNWQRGVKSEMELEYMRIAARFVERMHARIVEVAEPGLRKCDLVAEIYDASLRYDPEIGAGGGYAAIVPLLPSGADAAAPHLTWDDSELKSGEGTFFEIAGAYHRYHCPLSRTLYLGKPPQAFLDAEQAVLEGLEEGLHGGEVRQPDRGHRQGVLQGAEEVRHREGQPHRLSDRHLLSARLGRAHLLAPARRQDRAGERHDLPFHDRALDGGLGLRDHREHRHRRRRSGMPRQRAAQAGREGLIPMSPTAAPANPIVPTVPFDEDGKHHGFLRLPYSRDDSAWGSVMIPITVVRNGDGPTALLTGANHGDEYEGPVALQALTRDIDPKDIRGRVIIVPFMNAPAFRAARRTSPLDGVNLNRTFPGRPDGTPTQKIADYFNRTLAPMADFVLDFHSGGKTLDFVPFAAAHRLDASDQEAACIAAMRAFNAPYSMVLLEIDSVGMFDTAVEIPGKDLRLDRARRRRHRDGPLHRHRAQGCAQLPDPRRHPFGRAGAGPERRSRHARRRLLRVLRTRRADRAAGRPGRPGGKGRDGGARSGRWNAPAPSPTTTRRAAAG